MGSRFALCFRDSFGLSVFWFRHDLYRGAPIEPWTTSNRELFKFAVPLGLTEAIGILNKRLDRFLVVGLFAAAVVAEYEVGAWQIPFVATIPFSVGAAYTPRFRSLFAEGRFREGIEIWKLSSVKVGLIVMPICMIFIVAAEESITLLFGPQYAASAIVFRLYSIWTLLRIAAFRNVITAAGKPQFVLQAAGLSFLANIALSVPLTLWLGYYGAALGTLVSFIPMILFYCAKISEATDVPFSSDIPYARGPTRSRGTGIACNRRLVPKRKHHASRRRRTGYLCRNRLGWVCPTGHTYKNHPRDDWRYVKTG